MALAVTFEPYRPVVLLHAFPLNRTMWSPQVETLEAAGFSPLAPDLPGFGESRAVRAQSLDGFAAAVLETLDRYGIRRAAFVGLSMGGYVLFRIWERAPERVLALVLADTRAEPDAPEARERRLLQASQVEAQGPAAIADGFVQGALGATTHRARAGVTLRVRDLVLGAPREGVVQALHALAGRPDSRPLLPGIRVPTLILVGDEDTLTPPDASRAMAAAIPGSVLKVLPGAGHLANLEDPGAFNGALLDFLGTVRWH
ncbi:alpha/beta fold hydrolase [Caldinitratiruptor microaerophilus]|uniref:Alpha/beta hydrolase n=1 Tax=Caldinitratiruptor microaerophilus TaxID=671077 RepID=A0AA35CK88_9FIRM|nr:alpha/beta hydrolase [Caldinitratiruptor microaerophilus]BDG60825.1 alpha/beta hydrolase [Caldinitratiruptor microaerophilus]